MFENSPSGELVPVKGTDPHRGPWEHKAFLSYPLPSDSPDLSGETYRVVSNARATLAALDATARSMPNPRLFRQPTLRIEAQSTAALEGTYEPLARVLTASEDDVPDANLREVLNYVAVAEDAFAWVEQGRPWTVGMLSALQVKLMAGTPAENHHTGRIRPIQVVIGRRPDAAPGEPPIAAASFVPPPPGPDLEARVARLLAWMQQDHSAHIDPVVAAAMAHYEFEALHPFIDGNGRIGRLLIVLHLNRAGVISEPTLSVSPWFEARRGLYYDRLLAVSSVGDWDGWVRFFAQGLRESALSTHRRMVTLSSVQAALKEEIQHSHLRSGSARLLVDVAVSRPTFTIRQVERDLGISYGRARTLVDSLVELGVLHQWGPSARNRPFYAPKVMEVLLGSSAR